MYKAEVNLEEQLREDLYFIVLCCTVLLTVRVINTTISFS